MDKKKVFISYVRENSDIVDLICGELSKNDIDCWIDREDIRGGKLGSSEISRAITEADCFLAFFSKEFNDKSQTYMNEEIFQAIDVLRLKPINSGWFVPVKISECDIPEHNVGAGNTLRDVQYEEYYKDPKICIERLVDIIKKEEESEDEFFSKEYFEKEYVYRGLKSLIESGSGAGFHNADLGHPVYVLGATGKLYEEWEYADSPVKNTLFILLARLSTELKESGVEVSSFIWWYDFSEWKDFCSFALKVYNNNKP